MGPERCEEEKVEHETNCALRGQRLSPSGTRNPAGSRAAGCRRREEKAKRRKEEVEHHCFTSIPLWATGCRKAWAMRGWSSTGSQAKFALKLDRRARRILCKLFIVPDRELSSLAYCERSWDWLARDRCLGRGLEKIRLLLVSEELSSKFKYAYDEARVINSRPRQSSGVELRSSLGWGCTTLEGNFCAASRTSWPHLWPETVGMFLPQSAYSSTG